MIPRVAGVAISLNNTGGTQLATPTPRPITNQTYYKK